MARLHEYHGKAILARGGVPIPRGGSAQDPVKASLIASELLEFTPEVVVKVQAWTTGRAAAGGIAFAASGPQAGDLARRMLSMSFGRFPVSEVLVEERLAIRRELFLSLAIDERERAPVLLLSAAGGSGVEARAGQTRRVPCSVGSGPEPEALRTAVGELKLDAPAAREVERIALRVFEIARSIEARSFEINPLAVLDDGRVVAADCRVTIDDYAVARHPELGIDIARELDHPPTPLERAAYRMEQDDHRGTFFFAQMNSSAASGLGLIGFHGAGGGGSMMSMDAITNAGFTVANFCDTSGNPSPAKVYRAARVILSQPGLVGYFGSGSGVANQEQFWSAYGLAKAFWELELSIPAVIRLGGNTEDRAVDILQSACAGLPAKVEAYTKADPPARIAARLATLVAEHAGAQGAKPWSPRPPRRPAFVGTPAGRAFDVKGGRVWIDREAWRRQAPAVIARSSGLLRDEGGEPVPTVSAAELSSKDSEMIACEVECRRDGVGGPAGAVFVELETNIPADPAG